MGKSSLANSLIKMLIKETSKQVKKSVKNSRQIQKTQKTDTLRKHYYTDENHGDEASYQTYGEINTIHLDTIDDFEFEKLCKKIFYKLNYGNIELTPRVNDKGKDLIINSENGKIFVECKHHLDRTIGRPVVQKLHSALITERADKGIIVTTGHFSNGAIEYAKQVEPPIELIDKRLLYDYAIRAGIQLFSTFEGGNFYIFPMTDEDSLKNNLSSYLEQKLNSIPKRIGKNLRITKRKIQLKSIFMLDYEVDAVFSTSIGVIHVEQGGGKIFVDGTSGAVLGNDISNYLTCGKITNFSLKEDDNLRISPFKVLSNHLTTFATDYIIEKHTTTQNYVGRNNSSYSKICEPKKKDISIYNIQQVYAPENDISFDLVGKRRFFKITENGTPDFFILNDNISKCEICGHSLNQKGILCNECGNITHNKKLWKSHGFYCKNCGKSICRRCVEYYSKFLLLKVFLCRECSKQEQQRGKKIRKMKLKI